jgi:predicted nucleic acid-binding protein
MIWTESLPVDNPHVINASPLIFFSRGQKMELLHQLVGHIFVPEPVANEIKMRGPKDITTKSLKNTSWIEIVSPPPTPEIISDWALGLGESSVLAYAYANPGMEAIIDDLNGRRCAMLLNIPLRGTLGMILVAKKRGLIPKARPVIEELIRAGLYLSRQILNEALRRVDE